MEKRSVIAIVILLLFSIQTPAVSQSIDYLRIDARKQRNPLFGELIRCWAMLQAAPPSPFEAGQVSPEDLHAAVKRRVRSVSFTKNVSAIALQDKKFLGQLQEAWLYDTDASTESCLIALAKNCPDLRELLVTQKVPLSRESIRQIKNFHNLELLQLECPAEDPDLLGRCLPKSLEHLAIWEGCKLTELPNLNFLNLRYCQINEEFLASLHAPLLNRLDLSWVDLEKGSLKYISRFRNLSELQLYNTNLDRSDLQYIYPLEFLETTIHQVYRKGTPHWNNFLSRAEKSYEVGEFLDAVSRYQAICFSHPSEYLYERMACCYQKLGYTSKAQIYSDLALRLKSTRAHPE